MMSPWGRLAIPAPEDSPYSGAEFSVLAVAADDAHQQQQQQEQQQETHLEGHADAMAGVESPCSWVWESAIYHPWLAQGHSLCECVTTCGSGALRSPEEITATLTQLLRRPSHWQPCESCTLTSTQAFAEAQSDSAFFARKARVHTPGTRPLPDEDLMAIGRPAFDMQLLLTTGSFSDLKITVGKTAFRCHRTVLAAASAGFARLFSTQPDGGHIRIDSGVSPRSFGLFLKYIYLRQLPTADISLEALVDLIILASTYEVEKLHQFCMAALYGAVRLDTLCEIAHETLRLPQQHGAFTSQLYEMFAGNFSLLASTTACKSLMAEPEAMQHITAAMHSSSKDHFTVMQPSVDSPQN